MHRQEYGWCYDAWPMQPSEYALAGANGRPSTHAAHVPMHSKHACSTKSHACMQHVLRMLCATNATAEQWNNSLVPLMALFQEAVVVHVCPQVFIASGRFSTKTSHLRRCTCHEDRAAHGPNSPIATGHVCWVSTALKGVLKRSAIADCCGSCQQQVQEQRRPTRRCGWLVVFCYPEQFRRCIADACCAIHQQ
eukprot:352821-Chlamydomonas_euryale.AAC.7